MCLSGSRKAAASLVFAACVLATSVTASKGTNSAPTYTNGNSSVPLVSLEQGIVRGFRDNHTNSVFLGVPYAATTGGQNRSVSFHRMTSALVLRSSL